MNRPEIAPSEISRLDLSVFDYKIVRQWPCEYRYTVEEVQKMQSGDFRGVNVTRAEAAKVVQMINSLQDGRTLGMRF